MRGHGRPAALLTPLAGSWDAAGSRRAVLRLTSRAPVPPARLSAMAQPPPLLQLSDIALTFGGAPLLHDAELTVSAGDRICLVGRNGSGKSTLLRIAAGLVEPDAGTRFVQPGVAIR